MKNIITPRIPFIADEVIERDAETLLTEFADARRSKIRAPIPIEDIVEKHLKFHVEFDDLHQLLGVPRAGYGTDIFGAIWLESRRIVIDESLDPEVRPGSEACFRYTLAHEGGGHGRLHQRLFLAGSWLHASPIGNTKQPTVICRSSQARERIEIQADRYASSVLMPRKIVLQAWRDRFGGENPHVVRRNRRVPLLTDIDERVAKQVSRLDRGWDEQALEYFARPFAELFLVSPIAMRIRLEQLGLLLRDGPREKSGGAVLGAVF